LTEFYESKTKNGKFFLSAKKWRPSGRDYNFRGDYKFRAHCNYSLIPYLSRKSFFYNLRKAQTELTMIMATWTTLPQQSFIPLSEVLIWNINLMNILYRQVWVHNTAQVRLGGTVQIELRFIHKVQQVPVRLVRYYCNSKQRSLNGMALELCKYFTCTILTIKKKLSLNLNRGTVLQMLFIYLHHNIKRYRKFWKFFDAKNLEVSFPCFFKIQLITKKMVIEC
jgi:hypothetical protein